MGQTATSPHICVTSALPLEAGICLRRNICRDGSIVLQKSKVAGRPIFAKNQKREAIADSSNLNRATEVAYEFNVRR
jgi:hypothetical protein